MDELWKNVKDFDSIYQVSNLGNIKSLKRNIYRKNGKLHYVQPEKLLKPSLFQIGYYYISMHNGKLKKVKSVHSIVAEAFIENPHKKRTINHKDGNKLNNKVDNLEWATDSENLNHALESGLTKRFGLIAFNENCRIEFKCVIEAEKFGFSQSGISTAITKRKKYKNLNWEYTGETSKPFGSSSSSSAKQNTIEKILHEK